MLRTTSILAALLFAFALGTVAQAQMAAAPKGVTVLKAGDASILAGPTGLTLYVVDSDPAGKSTCNGPCAANWPPLAATATDKPVGDYTIVTRDDGSLQWAYKGKPLYYWKNDKAPLDTTGDGVAGKWHVAKP
jgi:predicted lipoprotein with Yx(FWY)xxD motif